MRTVQVRITGCSKPRDYWYSDLKGQTFMAVEDDPMTGFGFTLTDDELHRAKAMTRRATRLCVALGIDKADCEEVKTEAVA